MLVKSASLDTGTWGVSLCVVCVYVPTCTHLCQSGGTCVNANMHINACISQREKQHLKLIIVLRKHSDMDLPLSFFFFF